MYEENLDTELSKLNDAERKKIMEVLDRDLMIKRKQSNKIIKIKEEIDLLESKSLDIPVEHIQTATICARCRQAFSYFYFLNKADFCSKCGYKVCQKCQIEQAGSGVFTRAYSNYKWLCVLCHKQNEYLLLTGEWMYLNNEEQKEGPQSDNSSNYSSARKTSLTASQIIKLSISPKEEIEALKKEFEEDSFARSTLTRTYSNLFKAKSQSSINNKNSQLKDSLPQSPIELKKKSIKDPSSSTPTSKSRSSSINYASSRKESSPNAAANKNISDTQNSISTNSTNPNDSANNNSSFSSYNNSILNTIKRQASLFTGNTSATTNNTVNNTNNNPLNVTNTTKATTSNTINLNEFRKSQSVNLNNSNTTLKHFRISDSNNSNTLENDKNQFNSNSSNKKSNNLENGANNDDFDSVTSSEFDFDTSKSEIPSNSLLAYAGINNNASFEEKKNNLTTSLKKNDNTQSNINNKKYETNIDSKNSSNSNPHLSNATQKQNEINKLAKPTGNNLGGSFSLNRAFTREMSPSNFSMKSKSSAKSNKRNTDESDTDEWRYFDEVVKSTQDNTKLTAIKDKDTLSKSTSSFKAPLIRIGSNEVPVDPVPESTNESNNFFGGNHLSLLRRPKTSIKRATSTRSVDENPSHQAVFNRIQKPRIQINLIYEKKSSYLNVSIIKCENLPNLNLKTKTCDSYVKIYLIPWTKDKKNKRKTEIKKGNSNPEFNETFRYTIAYNELVKHKLSITVWHYDKFGRNKSIGEVIMPLDPEALSSSEPIWCTLNDNDSNSVSEEI